MKWYTYLICIVITIIGVFCTIELADMFGVKSLDIGTPIVVEKENTNELCKYDLSDLKFESLEDSSVYYTYSDSFEPIKYDSRFKEYKILLNGDEIPDVEYLPGAITSLITTNYYDFNNNLIATSQLSITITFKATQTLVELKSFNDSTNNISYLQKYIDINGFVLQIFDLEKEQEVTV